MYVFLLPLGEGRIEEAAVAERAGIVKAHSSKEAVK